MEEFQRLSGFGYLLLGFSLLGKRQLRWFVVIPLVINIMLFTAFIFISAHYFAELTAWIDSFLPSWLLILNILLWALFVITVGLFLVFFFTIIANIIGGPFNSLLASQVQALISQQPCPAEPWSSAIKDIPRTIGREGQKILYFIPRAIVCLILFFIPIVQIAAGLIWLLFNSWMLTLQYCDYTADNNRISLADFLQQLKTHKAQAISFGFAVSVMSLIPIVNFVVMPAAVAGGTAMWLDWQSS